MILDETCRLTVSLAASTSLRPRICLPPWPKPRQPPQPSQPPQPRQSQHSSLRNFPEDSRWKRSQIKGFQLLIACGGAVSWRFAKFTDLSPCFMTFHVCPAFMCQTRFVSVLFVSFMSSFPSVSSCCCSRSPTCHPCKPDPGEHFSLHSFSKKLSTLQTYSGYHEAGLWHLAPCDSQADTWACAWKAQDHAFLAGCSSWGLWCPLHLDALKSCGCSGLWVVSDRFISFLCEVMSLAGSFPSMASEVWIDPFRCLGVIRAGIARQRVLPVLCRLIWAMRSKKVWSRPVLRLSAIWPSQIVRAFDDAGVWGRKERGRASFRSVSLCSCLCLFLSIHNISIFQKKYLYWLVVWNIFYFSIYWE